MRKGHDFHKDKGGEIVKPWPRREKNPCAIFPCFIPTTFNKNGCWWLRQLMVFGSGVAGLSVLTHTHTPPLLTSRWKKKHFHHSHRILLPPRLCKSTHSHSTTQASRIAVHPLVRAEVAHVHALLATGILAIVCSLFSHPGFSWLLPT